MCNFSDSDLQLCTMQIPIHSFSIFFTILFRDQSPYDTRGRKPLKSKKNLKFQTAGTRQYLPLAVEGTHPASEPVSRLKGGAKGTPESVTKLNHYFLIVSQEVIRKVIVPPILLIGAPGGVGHYLLLRHMRGAINKLSKPMDPCIIAVDSSS